MASLSYVFPWDRLITRYKFAGDLSLQPALARLLINTVGAEHENFDAVNWVLPMPVSARRLRERGFNQSWELARPLARALRLAARHDLLLRWRETEHQTGLSREERNANLRGAFMPAPGARACLGGAHVALVDDVLTTGASAAEAARTLLEAGAARVDVWLLARTPEAPGAQLVIPAQAAIHDRSQANAGFPPARE
ncbi:MAG: ComF family protein [Vitreoscilla sp.]|nr:ComF family protein [Burkholderiales bacterium]MBP6338630.1 ComF family protein [Vitreoscilla sp.]MBP6674959.1 ComF family protein [Vitreoscilla sp.]